jgi:hypothetical protein
LGGAGGCFGVNTDQVPSVREVVVVVACFHVAFAALAAAMMTCWKSLLAWCHAAGGGALTGPLRSDVSTLLAQVVLAPVTAVCTCSSLFCWDPQRPATPLCATAGRGTQGGVACTITSQRICAVARWCGKRRADPIDRVVACGCGLVVSSAPVRALWCGMGSGRSAAAAPEGYGDVLLVAARCSGHLLVAGPLQHTFSCGTLCGTVELVPPACCALFVVVVGAAAQMQGSCLPMRMRWHGPDGGACRTPMIRHVCLVRGKTWLNSAGNVVAGHSGSGSGMFYIRLRPSTAIGYSHCTNKNDVAASSDCVTAFNCLAR